MLTKNQELEVHYLFDRGFSTEEIADRLNLDEGDVQDYFEEHF